MEGNVKNNADALIVSQQESLILVAICAEASQICNSCAHRNRLREFRWRFLSKKRFGTEDYYVRIVGFHKKTK